MLHLFSLASNIFSVVVFSLTFCRVKRTIEASFGFQPHVLVRRRSTQKEFRVILSRDHWGGPVLRTPCRFQQFLFCQVQTTS